MTRDSGAEHPQRTVAELLAEYGGTQGDAPRRRRRRAEDDGDSAPQTIIERVLSDSGKLLPIRDDQPSPGAPQATPPGQAPRRPGGHRSGDRRPAVPPPAPQPAQPPPAPQPPPGPPTAYAEPVRRPVPTRPVQQPPQQPAQQQPVPPKPPAPQPPAPKPAQQFPSSRPGMPPVGGATQAARPVPPPAGPPSRTSLRPVGRTPAPSVRTPRPARPPVDDEAATAVHPPLPDFAPQPAPQQPTPQQPKQPPPTVQATPVQQRLGGLPREATTEEFPLVPGEPKAPPAQQTRRQPPPPPPMESTQAHAGPYVDDDYDEEDYGPGGTMTAEPDSFPRREDFDQDDDEADGPAGGREWLLMAGQVGAGAIAGAAVWLAFSWLWGFQPVIAVIAALVVIVGLVLGVRRWRRAEDLQTTVLAILAGLVVTVSPAALLLLHR